MSKICGNCHYYTNSPMHGPWCSKNKKEVSYLQKAFDCWIEPGTAPTEEMQMKAVYAIADQVRDDELSADHVIPSALDKSIADAVAQAVASC